MVHEFDIKGSHGFHGFMGFIGFMGLWVSVFLVLSQSTAQDIPF